MIKPNFIPKMLKCLAFLAMTSVPLPLLIVAEGGIFHDFSMFRILLYVFWCVASELLGYFIYHFMTSDKENKKKVALVKVIVIAIMIGIFIFSFMFTQWYASIFKNYKIATINFALCLIPASYFWLLTGFRCSKKSFSDVYTLPCFAGYIVEALFCYLLYSTQAQENPNFRLGKDIIIIQLFIMVAIVSLLVNQTSINMQAQRRRDTAMIVPANLRGYNIKLISVVCAVILVGFTLKDFIAWLLETIGSAIIYAIDYLLQLTSSEPVDITSDDIASGKLDIIQGDSDIAFILQSLVYIVVIAMVIIFRKQIIKAISNLLNGIFGVFSNVKEEKDDDAAFTDFFEQIVTVKGKATNRITFKDCLKAYNNETDLQQKYRLGYKTILLWLTDKHVVLKQSDTTSQQYSKARKIFAEEQELINKIVSQYDNIRYNDIDVTADKINEIDQVIKELI